ncbi:hypothetical protein N7461_006134 [Penicillium sp. DV-2018c]|nr:hypothetical protein N7461_006134 [Penicillium sp. DV-2018c]
MIPAIEGGTASGWLPVRYIAAGVASRQAQVALRITLPGHGLTTTRFVILGCVIANMHPELGLLAVGGLGVTASCLEQSLLQFCCSAEPTSAYGVVRTYSRWLAVVASLYQDWWGFLPELEPMQVDHPRG